MHTDLYKETDTDTYVHVLTFAIFLSHSDVLLGKQAIPMLNKFFWSYMLISNILLFTGPATLP